jgi:phosphatidylinositol alpha-1,6-mannosyltransferase
MLIRRAGGAPAGGPGTALLLVSGGPYRQRLERLAARQGVAADVVFTGSVPWASCRALRRRGRVRDAVPHPGRRASTSRGSGIVYLEASACGLPVVGRRLRGAPPRTPCSTGETGLVVGGRDLGALTDRLVDLLSNPAKAAAMGAAGRAWIERGLALGGAGGPDGGCCWR